VPNYRFLKSELIKHLKIAERAALTSGYGYRSATDSKAPIAELAMASARFEALADALEAVTLRPLGPSA
jgi:hypothetical protein